MKITKLSQKGLDLIKFFEGWSSKPYVDPGTGNLPITIGYGSTRYIDGKKILLTDHEITKEFGEQLLKTSMIKYELDVDAYCVDTLNQNQFDAIVSFCYNCGPENLRTSTLLKKINANPIDPTIRTEFMKWNKGGGKVLKGLTIRRKAEADLYFS